MSYFHVDRLLGVKNLNPPVFPQKWHRTPTYNTLPSLPSFPQSTRQQQQHLIMLTLQTVGVEQVLALVVAFDAALGAAHALPRDAPQQALALVAVGGRGGRPHLEVVRRGGGDRVDEGLQGLLVHVALLQKRTKTELMAQDFFRSAGPLRVE